MALPEDRTAGVHKHGVWNSRDAEGLLQLAATVVGVGVTRALALDPGFGLALAFASNSDDGQAHGAILIL